MTIQTGLPARVLIVEDNVLLRRTTTTVLEAAGIQVYQAESGAAGLRLAREAQPDLVLLDIGLPDLDGTEVCRQLKHAPETAHILVALISSTQTDTLRQARGLEIGADAYIARPISSQELLARVEALLRLKRAEDQLRQANAQLQAELAARVESEARLRIVTENTYAWEFWLGPDDEFLYCSPSCERLTGYAAAEFMARPNLLREIVYPDDRPVWDAHECHVAATGQVDEAEVRIIRADGAIRWVAHACFPVHAADGRPWGRRGSSRDITAWREVEQQRQIASTALHQSEAQLQTLVANMGEGVGIVDSDERFIFANPAGEAIFGVPPGGLTGRRLHEFLSPEQLKIVLAQTSQRRAGLRSTYELEIRRPDGELRQILVTATPYTALTGERQSVFGVFRDITEDKRAEAALRESEALFRTLAETAASAIFIYQGETFRYVNPAAERLLGYPAHELVGMRFWAVVHPEDRDLVRERGLARQAGAMLPMRYTFRIINRAGETRWADFTGGRIQHEGQPAGLGTAFDITDLMKAQEAEREQRALAEALRDTASALASPLGFDAMLGRILEVVGRVMQHDAANFLLIEDGVARVVAHHGYEGRIAEDLLLAVRLPVATTLNLTSMMETGRPAAISDTRADPAWVDAPGTRWARSHAAAPIRVRGQCIGFLSLDSATPGFFTQAKANRLQVFADQAGIALENAQLLDETRQHADELAALHEITVSLASQTDLTALLDSIVGYARRLLRTSSSSIYLYDPARGDLELVTISGGNASRGTRLGLGEGAAGVTAVMRTPQRIDDYQRWASRSPQFDGLAIAAVVQAPLLYGGELIGVLSANEFHPSERRFTDDDTRLLSLLASHAAAAVRNAQLLRAMQAELAERQRIEEMLRTVLDTIPQRVFWKDRNSMYLGANYAFAADRNLPDAQAIVGKSDFELSHPSFAERFQAEDRQVIETNAPLLGFEEFIINPDGTQRWQRTSKVPLHDANGAVIGVLVTYEDITQQKQADEQLKKALAELERSNAELERFAYVASHDLQEPLRMVASFVQLLGERYRGQLDNDADEFIAFAVDGAKRMQRLINDLLEYSRVTTRGQPPQPTDANAALDDALWNLGLTIEEAGASVTHDPLPMVLADPTQLMQLFQNLIGNAIKFRGAAPPAVHVSARQMEDETSTMDDGKLADAVAGSPIPHRTSHIEHPPSHIPHPPSGWVFSVRDNGIGIAPEYHECIFGVFQRLHTRQEYPGTGIGLAVCQKIVERHGGRIWVESQLGQGSTFYFTLPAA